MSTSLPAVFRLIFLPYVLKRLEDGRYVVLNRRYKPLGQITTEFVDYTPHAVRLQGLTAKKAAAISYEGSNALDSIYLYADGCVPTGSIQAWTAYQKRLAVLAQLRVE